MRCRPARSRRRPQKPGPRGSARNEVRNQEIQVGEALAMAVRGHVDRHPVDGDSEVGAGVEVEAAQEILVGLTVARMLGGHHAKHRFDDVAWSQLGPCLERLLLGRAFAGAAGRAEGGVTRAALAAHLAGLPGCLALILPKRTTSVESLFAQCTSLRLS